MLYRQGALVNNCVDYPQGRGNGMSRRAWTAFIAAAILFGVPYLFIKIAVTELAPAFITWVRLVVVALMLLPICAYRGSLSGALAQWRWVFVLGVFYLALAMTLLAFSEQFISSSLTAIIVAGTPIVAAVVNLRHDRPSSARVGGLAMGFVGVAALVGLDIGSNPSQLLGIACLLVVIGCFAVGPVLISRKLNEVAPIATSGLAAAFAAVVLTPMVVFNLPSRIPSVSVLLSLAVLAVLCTALGLITMFVLIQEAGPSRATTYLFVNPLVAVLAGVLVLHERIGAASMLGMILILGGSWLATVDRLPLWMKRKADAHTMASDPIHHVLPRVGRKR
jgi:drug/metabolite transporter (DMT)-like permease